MHAPYSCKYTIYHIHITITTTTNQNHNNKNTQVPEMDTNTLAASMSVMTRLVEEQAALLQAANSRSRKDNNDDAATHLVPQ